VDNLFREVCTLLREDEWWLNDAAGKWESIATSVDGKKAGFELLAAVYRERAMIHRKLITRMLGEPPTR